MFLLFSSIIYTHVYIHAYTHTHTLPTPFIYTTHTPDQSQQSTPHSCSTLLVVFYKPYHTPFPGPWMEDTASSSLCTSQPAAEIQIFDLYIPYQTQSLPAPPLHVLSYFLSLSSTIPFPISFQI